MKQERSFSEEGVESRADSTSTTLAVDLKVKDTAIDNVASYRWQTTSNRYFLFSGLMEIESWSEEARGLVKTHDLDYLAKSWGMSHKPHPSCRESSVATVAPQDAL